MDLAGMILMGLVDGLNICSLSLLALLLSLMYNAGAQRRTIVLLGFVYIVSVFASYFLAGLGILAFSVLIPGVSHFFTEVSVAIMLFIGTVNILNYFQPGFMTLSLPMTLGKTAIKYMKILTLPSLFVTGLLVGLHNFPCACTGGIYLSFISLIADSPFHVGYLVLYNFVFVLPLVTILYVCSSKPLTVKYRKWQMQNTERMKLVLGTSMVLVSLLMILFISSGLV